MRRAGRRPMPAGTCRAAVSLARLTAGGRDFNVLGMLSSGWARKVRGWALGAGVAAAAAWLIVVAWPPAASARSTPPAAPGPHGTGGPQVTPAQPSSQAVTPRDLTGILSEAQRIQHEDVTAWRRYKFRRQTVREWFDEDGALVEKEDLLFVVTPITGGFDEELIRMNGSAPAPDDVDHHRREAKFTRHYNEMMQSESGDDIGEAGYTLATLLKMSAYEYAGMEVVDGILCHRLDFRPDDALEWGGIAGKIARAMSGTLWITADGHHVAFAHTRTVRPVTLFWSLSKVKELEITMQSRPAPEGVWLPARIEVVSTARVLFNVLRKRNTINYSDFEPAQAAPPGAAGR